MTLKTLQKDIDQNVMDIVQRETLKCIHDFEIEHGFKPRYLMVSDLIWEGVEAVFVANCTHGDLENIIKGHELTFMDLKVCKVQTDGRIKVA